MPYEEDGILKMVIGQGADGAQEVLYQSEDEGISWEFVKEIR
jgi:sucrose-6-phosphate hydrolase SacC (GH32 family)